MAETPPTYVVDANVALKLFFEQPGSERADALFSRLAPPTRARLYVPDFFYAECTSAFANYVRATSYTPAAARTDMADLLALPLRAVATAELAQPALDIALAHRLSGYDALYVALAVRLSAPLVTADERLVRALAGTGFPVQSLAGLDIPA